MDTKGPVLFMVLFKVCLMLAIQDEPFNCNRYIDYVQHDWSCRPDGLISVSHYIQQDGIVTKDELLNEVRAHCSNSTLKADYSNCIATLAMECPEQYRDLISDDVREKMNIFCEGGNVSQWLESVVWSGYSFNNACSEVSGMAMQDCALTLNYVNKESVGSNISLVAASIIVPMAVTDLFQCMKTKLATIASPVHACGSTWQDILIDFWLQMGSYGSFFMNLSHSDRQAILVAKTGSSAVNTK